MSFNSQRGTYGNNYQGNRGGNRGNGGGGNYRGGNRSNYNSSNGNSGGDQKYVRSSSFVKETEYQDGFKEKLQLPEGVTEKISMSFTADKAAQLIAKIQAAVNQPDGDGGIRITMYCQHKVPERGPSYDSANIMVVGKYPPKNGGSFNGGGRRDYPEHQAPRGPQGSQEAMGGTPTGYHNDGSDQKPPMNDPAYNAGPINPPNPPADHYSGTTRW